MRRDLLTSTAFARVSARAYAPGSFGRFATWLELEIAFRTMGLPDRISERMAFANMIQARRILVGDVRESVMDALRAEGLVFTEGDLPNAADALRGTHASHAIFDDVANWAEQDRARARHFVSQGRRYGKTLTMDAALRDAGFK